MLKICVPLAALVISFPAGAQNCPALDGARKLESDRYVLSYRTQPPKLAVGQHFTVELAVCPKAGQPAPEAVRVDGFMPEHNHGMNYKAAVKPLGNGRYDAAGLMFHMPGKWDFIFELRSDGKVEKMTHSVILQ